MKSADSIYSAVDLPETGRFLSCSELNKAALDLALSVASPVALKRKELFLKISLEKKHQQIYIFSFKTEF